MALDEALAIAHWVVPSKVILPQPKVTPPNWDRSMPTHEGTRGQAQMPGPGYIYGRIAAGEGAGLGRFNAASLSAMAGSVVTM